MEYVFRGQGHYVPTRQTGSHVRLTCESPAQHHVTVPLHDPLRIGTLAAILAAVAHAHGLTRDELQQRLFA
jgi:predicted RNA binding protein YcfA (HicA-like mRNA interferase family)